MSIPKCYTGCVKTTNGAYGRRLGAHRDGQQPHECRYREEHLVTEGLVPLGISVQEDPYCDTIQDRERPEDQGLHEERDELGKSYGYPVMYEWIRGRQARTSALGKEKVSESDIATTGRTRRRLAGDTRAGTGAWRRTPRVHPVFCILQTSRLRVGSWEATIQAADCPTRERSP